MMGHNFSFCKTCETPLDCDFCDKLAALREPGGMTLEELKAEAKRQGYKLCGLQSLPAEGGESQAIEMWNRMILEKREERKL